MFGRTHYRVFFLNRWRTDTHTHIFAHLHVATEIRDKPEACINPCQNSQWSQLQCDFLFCFETMSYTWSVQRDRRSPKGFWNDHGLTDHGSLAHCNRIEAGIPANSSMKSEEKKKNRSQEKLSWTQMITKQLCRLYMETKGLFWVWYL